MLNLTPTELNTALKSLAHSIIKEHGFIEGNARGEELFQDSVLGRSLIAIMIVKGGQPNRTLTSCVEML